MRIAQRRRLAATGTLLAGLALCGSPAGAAASHSRPAGAPARAARISQVPLRTRVTCTGAPRLCPRLHSSPMLYSYLAGQPVRPLLTGNAYAIYSGVWLARSRPRLTFEWLSRRGRVVSRSDRLIVPESLAGAVTLARECARTAAATSCTKLRAPEALRTPRAYLAAACGASRPKPPPYDPNFALLSAPRITGGWNPCESIVWAIDEYGEPPLASSEGATWRSLVARAVAQLGDATGIRFVQAPAYSLAPNGTFAPRPAGVELAIAFQPLRADVGGLGGQTSSRGQFATGGGVEIASNQAWNVPEATVAVLHELGHAMGLGHPVPKPPAPDPLNVVMDPAVTPFTSYRPGDLCGLYEIVWRAPCAGSATVTLGQGVVAQ
ncbi:MAG TPA: hypothetical protein VN618_02440 [Solirubrobacteraceae bacterium]|nr:hypothetical protein [Solirubrobacteraceae bacterium]